ncbi:sigma-70 family RNA polymerase sigma factor [Leifsonia shinshuensis]|uniref:sigma-70 family RNA polymerase sigma factor n=1 Tax=Leifsonia shinshuensis TaxID=150026 RepID=UPI001F5052B8|nr:sigma-70 family RNA polymerase sigma factor [Leifsonia shinshuensis]MCI0159309.1 sigma-70 family RNA polymerase sigma factor [Leifsonia shinshuensis]
MEVGDALPERWRPSDAEQAETDDWRRRLTAGGPVQRDAEGQLYELLLRVARGEVHRRAASLPFAGPELDDVAHQAAADATLGVLRRLHEFRGESRFTTWAYTFAIFEVSTKTGRHFWQHRTLSLDAAGWDRLPDRLGISPEEAGAASELLGALRHAIDSVLSRRQREVLLAVIVEGVPLEALAVTRRTTRGALYKVVFDARRKLRDYLVTHHYLDEKGLDDESPDHDGPDQHTEEAR